MKRLPKGLHPRRRAAALLPLALILAGGAVTAAGNERDTFTSREQIDAKYKWNMADLYQSEELWEKDSRRLQEQIPKYAEFEGKLGTSAAELLAALTFNDQVHVRMDRLRLYCMLAKDRDLGAAKYQGTWDRTTTLGAKLAASGAFLRPELLAIPPERLHAFMQHSEKLRVYRHYFDNLLRTKKHTLPTAQEKLLAMSMPVGRVPSTTFSILNNADLKFPLVEDPRGEEVRITTGKYYGAMFSTDRAYRQRVYKGYYQPYMEFRNTLGSLLSGSIKGAVFRATARNYPSTLEAALTPNNIPPKVYENLVDTVNGNLASLHRWCRLRRRVLGLDEMHPYDAYVTLFPAAEKRYTYDEGKELVVKALAPLGKDYVANLEVAFENRWVDVYETPGKRSGAYSSGPSYGAHPYVLMNWNGTLKVVFTLAHEMGHCMHSYYTARDQPYVYSDYSTFVAEVAAITNEALLRDYLIEHAETKQQRMAMIEQELVAATSTFFRQARFAEFERHIHRTIESGGALTPDVLTEQFGDTYQKYWGPAMIVDREEGHSWARIPHFYYNFYVYQYATSYAASQSLAAKIKREGPPAVDRYLALLKSGDSKYPIELLTDAGVDMTSPQPLLQVVERMNELLDELEKLGERQ